MGRYIARRLLLLIPVVFGVALIVFFSVRLVPGDTIEAQIASGGLNAANTLTQQDVQNLREELGLDKPAYQQFWIWLGDLFQGDLGHSFQYRDQTVFSRIQQAIPVSLELMLLAMVIGVLIAIPLGILGALRQDSWIDYGSRLLAIGGLSVPEFVLALLVLTLPAIWFDWFPYLKYRPFIDDPVGNLKQFILPSLAIGIRLSATTMRMTRSSMLEVMRSDYIRTAWAKGLHERQVVVRHALKNAMIAPITIIGTNIGFLIGGTVIIEQIFNFPGVGRVTLEAIQNRDYAQIQGNVFFIAVVFVVVNLLVDLSYSLFDPRIRYS